ncbi:MAG: hypothetical protein ABIG93_01035 [archaeon]|nr:hypothetical protein [Nanoarchaeota archaeon]
MYQLEEQTRNEFADKVAGLVQESQRDRARQETRELSDLFEGQELNVTGVLYRAAENDRFYEFAGKLRDYHRNCGDNVSAEGREVVRGQDVRMLKMLLNQVEIDNINPNFPKELHKMTRYPDAIREELFFFKCYEDLMTE